MKEKKKINKHIIIMGVIGIIMALVGLLYVANITAFFMLGVLPFICSVLFIIFKNPLFGIIYTVIFFWNRMIILLVGTLLARVGILALIIYFIYVDYISIKEWKEKKKLHI